MVKVKRIRDESEYKSAGGSGFISLDEGESFLGIALFVGDPKEDEPGFFPYKVHWIDGKGIPCAEGDCVYCEDGDRPRSKAYTLWLVLEDETGSQLGKKGAGELRIFDMPVTVIKQFNEIRNEGDKILGRKFRVKRPDEKTYVVLPKADAALKSSEVKAWLKDEKAPDFEAMLNSKLKKAMEGVAIKRVLDDDDDTPAKSKKSGKKAKDEEPDEEEEAPTADEWPDELEDATVTVQSVEDEGNFFTAVSSEYDDAKDFYTNDKIAKKFDLTDLSKGDEVTVSAELDGDGDYLLGGPPEVAEAKEDDDDESSGNDLPDSIEGVEMVVTGQDESDSTLDVENDEMSFTLWILDTVKLDFDDYKAGTKVIVSAEKDRAGDLVTAEAPEVVAEKKKGDKKASSGKKGGGKKTTTKKGGKGK